MNNQKKKSVRPRKAILKSIEYKKKVSLHFRIGLLTILCRINDKKSNFLKLLLKRKSRSFLFQYQ